LAMLWNAGNPGIELSVKEMVRAGMQLGIELRPHGMKSAEDLRPLLEGVARERDGAVFVFDDVLVTTHKTQILTWAAKSRLPILSQYAELTEAGGLMSYGPNIPDIYRRAAIYVDKILKGAKPAELPVEQPTKLELVLNLKSAKALGVKVPDSIL